MNRVVRVNDSTLIVEVGYSPPSSVMYVKFKNGQGYVYENVPVLRFTDLIGAESIGTYFARYIRDSYPCQKVANA